MQDISPKDRPKLYALIGAVVVVFIIGGKTITDSLVATSPAPPPAGASPGAAPAVAGVAPGASPAPGAAPVPGAAPGADGAYIVGNGVPSSAGRDPFTPVPDDLIAKYSIGLKGLVATPTPSPTPQAIPRLPGTVPNGVIGEFNRGIRGIGQSGQVDREIAGIEGNPAPVPSPVVRVLAPPAPPYAVIGVLIGEPGGRDVAILRREGGTDKKFVVVGDPLEGGFTVAAIESSGVVVKHPGRSAFPTTVPGQPTQTTVVPPTTVTLLLGAAPAPGTPGASGTPSRVR